MPTCLHDVDVDVVVATVVATARDVSAVNDGAIVANAHANAYVDDACSGDVGSALYVVDDDVDTEIKMLNVARYLAGANDVLLMLMLAILVMLMIL